MIGGPGTYLLLRHDARRWTAREKASWRQAPCGRKKRPTPSNGVGRGHVKW